MINTYSLRGWEAQSRITLAAAALTGVDVSWGPGDYHGKCWLAG